MKYWLTLAIIAAARIGSVNGQSCTPGAYRCSSPSGKGTAFLQCDAGGTEIQQSCAPGTVCFTQGSTILCSYPVDTSSQPPPANNQLTAGSQCSSVSPFDEYMCPGANGQHNYFLRCLSGTFVHFACPPGTACIKNEGQNMVCGWPSQGSVVPASIPDNTPPVIGTSDLATTSSLVIDIGATTSKWLPGIDIGGSISESPSEVDIGGSTSKALPDIDIGGSETELSLDTDIDAWPSSSSATFDSGTSTEESTSSALDLSDDLTPLFPTTSSDILSSLDASSESSPSSTDSSQSDVASSTDSSQSDVALSADTASQIDTAEPSSSVVASAESSLSSSEEANTQPPTATMHDSGLTGPVISSGLQMLLQNGVKLPFMLPNIDLPEINLATVHLPDMTFDGIAITGIPLPSVTIPPMNPASLTNFNYIEEIMSKAGVTFDDLAKLPLPDLNKIDLSDLDHLDVASIASMVNVNRVSVQDSVSAQDLVKTLPPASDAPHTTTLDADGIDALLGLQIITFSTA
ncbi:hypothetical protein IW136_002683 [Coemansia sp. RSA 678]|nr:hypothetical protein IW136_002683 [Coemansia sp. RSA 678]